MAFVSSARELADYVCAHTDKSLAQVDVFPAADEESFAKALSGKYKIYLFHATGEGAMRSRTA